MFRFCLATWLGCVFLCLPGLPPAPAQAEKKDPEIKEEAARQRLQQLLDEQLVETRPFQTEMPLAKFLAALEKQLPREKKVSLRLDGAALGDKLADVAATPMTLPPVPKRTSLRRVLEAAIAKSKTRIDYRLDAIGVALTTPERALYTTAYDIRDLVAKPLIAFPNKEPLRSSDSVQKAALVVEALVSALEEASGKPTPADRYDIQILNGTRLVVHANAARHALVADLLQAFRRLGDVAVFVQAHLHEVDDAFYTRLKNARRVSLDELERQAIGGAPPREDSLFKLLAKQKLVLAGEEVKSDNGQEVALLSRHQVVRCLRSPDQARRGEKGPQTVLDGVSFLAGIQVSADRRFVRVKLTEKAAALQTIDKVKVEDATGKEVEAETPFVKEATQTQVLEIPDGGSILVPVQYRPRAAQAKERWWVLSISPRIFIAEEEKERRKGAGGAGRAP